MRLAVRIPLFLVLLAWLPAVSASTDPEQGVVLTHYADFGTALEVSRRVLSPVTHDRVLRLSERDAIALREHDVDLAAERYDLVVPAHEPEGGYGVLVFVAPVAQFPLTRDWRLELERRGLIYVAAHRSGNTQNVLKRRIPLALHGLAHVLAEYRVDRERVYVAGFSGGSRVAQRLAMGWPDLFRGVLLVGGSDPLGEDGLVPSPPELMALFQTRSRVVFATGSQDLPNRAKDARTRESFTAYCLAGVVLRSPPRLDHWVPGGRALRLALDALERPVVPGPDHEACRSALQAGIAAELDRAEANMAAGDLPASAAILKSLDDRYGGLASPRLERMVRRLDELTESARD